MKRCSKCKEMKRLDEFVGHGYCHDCTIEYNAKYYAEHAEEIKARRNERYANDAEFRRRRSEYMKAYNKRKKSGAENA